MRDEMDARIWDARHEDFSNDLASAGAQARRIVAGVPMPLKLMAAVLAASLAALSAPPPAFAGQAVQAPSATVAVPYGDLNLATQSGRDRLAARIEGAAQKLCRPYTVGSLRERADRSACFTAAIADAEVQVARALAARDQSPAAIIVAAR